METVLLIVAVVSSIGAIGATTVLLRVVRDQRARADARVEALRTLAFPHGTPVMFASTSRAEDAAPRRRWMAVAAVAGVMASALGAGLAVYRVDGSGLSERSERPVELVALQQSAGPAGFVVSGEIRQARHNASRDGLTARVELYDERGAFLAGGTAPVASVSAQGRASAFAVTLPATAGVARYRVRFQHKDGAAVPHVDRRASHLPASEERTGS